MPDDPQPEGVFHRPFTEQVAFFRRKLGNLVPTARWDDLEREAHDSAFMVAGAAKADLLADLGAAVDKAITEGRGLEEFRRDFRAIVAKNGWTGWTGEGSVKGEAWRTGVIYRTNSYTSYAAGRLAQLRAANFPFWVYRHGGSEHPRRSHLAIDGLILPSDDPAWAKLYPPSDWGCSCYVVGARSERAAKRLGGKPEVKLPANWERMLGKGWDYAPGASVSDEVNKFAGKLGAWDYQIAKAFMEELPVVQADALADAYRALPSTADDARRYAQRVYEGSAEGDDTEGGGRRPLPPQRTLGRLRSDQVDEINELLGGDVGGYDFSFDRSAVEHVLNNHGPGAERVRRQRAVEADDFAALPRLLSRPDSVRLAGTSEIGETIVEFAASIGGEEFVARFAVRGKKRRTLALKTFFVKVKG